MTDVANVNNLDPAMVVMVEVPREDPASAFDVPRDAPVGKLLPSTAYMSIVRLSVGVPVLITAALIEPTEPAAVVVKTIPLFAENVLLPKGDVVVDGGL